MRRHGLALVFLTLLWSLLWCMTFPAPLAAGAWMQTPGTGFSSLDLRYRVTGDTTGRELGFYGAYGLSDRITLGLDINDAATDQAHALAFVRIPLRQASGGWQLSTEVAAGLNHEAGYWLVMHRYGLSVGRSLSWGRRSGWASADLSRESRSGGRTKAWKLDATLGLNARENRNLAPMLQIEIYQPDHGDAAFAVLPTWRFSRGEGRTWVAGLEVRKSAATAPVLGIRFGLWQSF